ncbi:MAG: hypothetical protein GY791_17015 [Alphaproteobacteria bacterium]|nr:hypothetical protein [Alphaproteobacteria bacterium]
MLCGYRARHLTATDICRAYPLIQAAFADLSLEDWTRFARIQIEDVRLPRVNSGIVAVENESGYLHGLFSFKIVDDGLVGRVLNCDHFVVLELLPIGEPLAKLVSAANRLGRDNNCVQVHICIPTRVSFHDEASSPMIKLLNDAGFDRESVRFRGTDDRGGDQLKDKFNLFDLEGPQ